MCQITIGIGADELAPEMFIGMGFGLDPGGGNRRFWFCGKRAPTLVAKLRVFLVLLLALCAGFHQSEIITMETPPG